MVGGLWVGVGSDYSTALMTLWYYLIYLSCRLIQPITGNYLHTQIPGREVFQDVVLVSCDFIVKILYGASTESDAVNGVWCGTNPRFHECTPYYTSCLYDKVREIVKCFGGSRENGGGVQVQGYF